MRYAVRYRTQLQGILTWSTISDQMLSFKYLWPRYQSKTYGTNQNQDVNICNIMFIINAHRWAGESISRMHGTACMVQSASAWFWQVPMYVHIQKENWQRSRIGLAISHAFSIGAQALTCPSGITANPGFAFYMWSQIKQENVNVSRYLFQYFLKPGFGKIIQSKRRSTVRFW